MLDAWAVMALYEDHPCAAEVEAAIDTAEAVMSAINLGEVLYKLKSRTTDTSRPRRWSMA